MLIPVEVDVFEETRPVCNVILVVFTCLCFVAQIVLPEELWEKFILDSYTLAGFFGYIFLHGGVFHLIGNLIFLWLFGNAINSKIGNLWYLPLYLAMGLIAGLLHMITGGGAVVGASGAISGLTGMFLILFPYNEVKMMILVFIPPIFFNMRSYMMILLWFIKDIHGAIAGHGNIAYFAHIGGFLAGVALAVVLIIRNLIPLDRYDRTLITIMNLDRFYGKGREMEVSRKNLSKESEPQFKPKENLALKANQIDDLFMQPKPASTTKIPQKIVQISFYCSCGKKIRADKKHAGKRGKCPACSSAINIPRL